MSTGSAICATNAAYLAAQSGNAVIVKNIQPIPQSIAKSATSQVTLGAVHVTNQRPDKVQQWNKEILRHKSTTLKDPTLWNNGVLGWRENQLTVTLQLNSQELPYQGHGKEVTVQI